MLLLLFLCQQLRLGVHDVIPRNSLDNLTAEDFRLLLNGQNDIDVQTLISYTSFNDESGTSAICCISHLIFFMPLTTHPIFT